VSNFLDVKLITFTSGYYFNGELRGTVSDTNVLERFFPNDVFIVIGFILLSISIFFKLIMAPFHL
jgi:NADH:ubiquinone oxidoreductase subunit 2 (subunit N)